ncbi:MAG: zinc ribbon domain-containing protein [Pseudomonadota bacterium]
MAMTKCDECGVDVSTKAESCPKCGAPISPKKNVVVKTKKKTSVVTWLVTILIAIGVISSIASESKEEKRIKQDRQNVAKITKIHKENAKYFETHSKEVLASIEKEMKASNFGNASAITGKYLLTKDSKILSFHKEARTNTVLKRLKGIPEKDFGVNQALYAELVELNPNSSKYKNKLISYTKKLNAKNAKDKAVADRKTLIEKSFSSWDGSHRGLESTIKASMNDPGSYEHVETRYGDKGSYLFLQTTFRGKNKFGGVVKQTISAKASLEGKILQIYD